MKQITPVRLFLLLAALVAGFVQPWLRTGTEALISWDELGYYLYLPAAFIYHDVRQLAFLPELLLTYQPTGYFYQALRLDGGTWVMAYTLWLSLLEAPFFLLGHAVAHFFDYPADGLSAPYQCAVWCSGVFYTALGVRALSRFLGEYFELGVVLLVVALLLLGTNLLTYSLLTNALTHCYLFALYAGLLRATQRWHQQGQLWHLLAIAGCLGLMITIRPSEAVAVLIPVLWGLHAPATRALKWQLVGAQWGRVLLVGVVGLLPWTLQMAYWHWATGHWLYNYYEQMGLGFDWTTPHFLDVFFSARKGWLLYTPLATLLLISLGFLFSPKGRLLRWPVLVFVLVSLYITSSWRVWWYGGSLGQRALVPLYAVLAFPLALMSEWVLPRRRLRVAMGAIAGVFVLVNLSFTWQYHVGNILADGTEIRHYKEYLVNPIGDYIPVGHRASPHVWNETAIAARVLLRADSLRPDHGPGLRMGAGGIEYGANQELPAQELVDNKVNRLRFSLDAYVPQRDPYAVNGLKVVMETRNGQNFLRKWWSAPAYRLFGKGSERQWHHFVQDAALPRTLRYSDVVRVFLWCPGPDSTLVRNFRIEGLQLK